MTNWQQGEFHTPVLLQEAVEALHIRPEEWYVDCTVGGGGHSEAILKGKGKLLGIDQDSEALHTAETRLLTLKDIPEFRLRKANFKDIDEIVKREGIEPMGILFDLGVSSYQFGGNQRGFSFQTNELLDMRMDPETQTVRACDLLNGLYENELEKLIATYGEDPLARNIAKAVVCTRNIKPIETTFELAEIVGEVYRKTYSSHSRLNPATRTFQALRIAVNDELNVLKHALEMSLLVLKSGGRISIISFHGLEDKTVKNTFKDWEKQQKGTTVTGKPIEPSEEEISQNPRSRSAKLRIFEKN